MKCPNCKTAAYMSAPWPSSGRCGGCGWYFGGLPDPTRAEVHAAFVSAGWTPQWTAEEPTPTRKADHVWQREHLGTWVPFTSDRLTEVDATAFWQKQGKLMDEAAKMMPLVPWIIEAPESLYDGLTAEQCLERYVWLQRHDEPATAERVVAIKRAEGRYLTACQLAAARTLWAAQLRARVAETAKPKLTVMVQVDDE